MIRYENNPIVKKTDIPDIGTELADATSVFNPGAIKVNGKYLMMLRVQNRGRRTFFIMSESNDGITFKVEDKVVEFKGLENLEGKIYHLYDPRLFELDGSYYVIFAMDIDDYCCIGLGKTEDWNEFQFCGVVSKKNVRNGVLFPEKINGYYYKLERPNDFQIDGGPLTGNSISVSKSNNLFEWQLIKKIAYGNKNYWDELIGSGPPPVKTKKGWLSVYHGIAMHYAPIYQVGVMLLDLNDPSIVIARGSQNILEPREYYELVGQVPNVVFPTGLIVEEYDEDGFAKEESEVKLYYGAADTSVALATSTIGRLLEQCYE